MKILLLCNKSPWPPLEGGPIAMNAMATGLIKAGHQVKILAINSNKYSVSHSSIPGDYRLKTGIETVYIDLSVRPLAAFFNLFTGRSYHVERFITRHFENALTAILKKEKFDIIQFETLFTSPYLKLIRSLSDAKVILRAHNIEHLIWERIAGGCANPVKKLYLNHLARTLKLYELETLHKVDGIVAITNKDASFFKDAAPDTPVISIPFGMSTDESDEVTQIANEGKPPTLFHLGSMNWIPNQEGIRWFIKNVWPVVSARYPELKFHLAGREMPDWLKETKIPGIVIDGEVPDARAYMLSHSIMIVPLFSGSGIRIKIIEGMQARKAIITTAIGAEGIAVANGEHLLLAENSEGFVNAIDKCIETPELMHKLGQNAHMLVMRDHNNDALMQKISEFYQQLMH